MNDSSDLEIYYEQDEDTGSVQGLGKPWLCNFVQPNVQSTENGIIGIAAYTKCLCLINFGKQPYHLEAFDLM